MNREKIIKGLECCTFILGKRKCNECPYQKGLPDNGCYQLQDDFHAILKEQEADGNKWIKCSDEMPEEQETIFAKFKGTDKWSPAMFAQISEYVRVVIVFAHGTRRVSHSHTIDGKWECEKSPLKRTVTHWMPNPELPKEGQ